MPTDTHSVKAKVASDGPREAPSPEQSSAESSSKAKDTETLFKEAFEQAIQMTAEERLEKCPILKGFTAEPVPVDKGMQILEEMEREDLAKLDETETTGANNAS